MATETDGTTTPPEVVIAATETADLKPFAVIGIFGSTEVPRALIRSPNGDITRVTVGDTISGGRVAAIGLDRVVIAKRGKTTVLTLPHA